jgi:hypothetical protein
LDNTLYPVNLANKQSNPLLLQASRINFQRKCLIPSYQIDPIFITAVEKLE